MHEQWTPERIMQTGLAFWPSKTLLSAIELGVPSPRSAAGSGCTPDRRSISSTRWSRWGGADCVGWMKAAGFSSTRVEPLVGPDSMVIAIK